MSLYRSFNLQTPASNLAITKYQIQLYNVKRSTMHMHRFTINKKDKKIKIDILINKNW